jgi:hypothetical protein
MKVGTAVWLAGSKEETGQYQPGIGQSSNAHEMIKALLEIGLLDDIIDTEEGLVMYPAEMVREAGDTN